MATIVVALEMLALLLLSNQVAMTAMTIGAVGLLAWAQGIVWLLGRSTRDLWGADETLGRERAILAGFLWRRVAVLRRWRRERRQG